MNNSYGNVKKSGGFAKFIIIPFIFNNALIIFPIKRINETIIRFT